MVSSLSAPCASTRPRCLHVVSVSVSVISTAFGFSFFLLFLFLLCLMCNVAQTALAFEWDRNPPNILTSDGTQYAARIPIMEQYYWLDTIQPFNNSVDSNTSSLSCDQSKSNSVNTETPWLLLKWSDPLPGSNDYSLFGMIWPPSFTPSRRAQFIPLPLIGSVPSIHGPNAVVTMSASGFAGHIFVKPGSFASLWTLHVPSATWRPLGPSRMSDFYSCDGSPYNASWSNTPVQNRWRSSLRGDVDDCWFSDISMPQVDEFGCPWPAPRDNPILRFVNDSIILMMGSLSSGDPSGDVWRLKLDSALYDHYNFQAASRDRKYVYNSDQAKYLRNSHDPSVDRNRLCPVKWELLTVGGHSSRLRGSSLDAAVPVPRTQAAFTIVNSSSILFGGGLVPDSSSAGDQLVIGDLWLLQVEPTPRWVQFSDRISPPTYNAGQSDFLVRHSYIVEIMSVRIADVLPAPNTTFQLPAQLASCINSTAPAILLTNGFRYRVPGKSSFIESPWLLLPPCDVVWRAEAAAAQSAQQVNGCNVNSTASDWDLRLPDGSFDSKLNWTAVPLPLRPVDGSFTGIVQNAQYHFFPQKQQLVAVGGGVYGTYKLTAPRIYDFRARTRYDVPTYFPVMQEPDNVVQNRPAMRRSSYSQLLGRWMYIFGGWSVLETEQANEMWRFNVDTYEWQLLGKRVLGPNLTQETWQTPQVSASGSLWPRWAIEPAVWYETRLGTPRYMYRFGGNEFLWPQDYVYPYHITYGFTPCLGGFYRFNLVNNVWENITDSVRSNTRWTQSEAEAAASAGYVRDGFIYPRPRCTASSIVLDDAAYMFGGNGFPYDLVQTTVFSNDLWKLNLTTLEWTLLTPGNLSLSSAADVFHSSDTNPPATGMVPIMRFPMPDGSGFAHCYPDFSMVFSGMTICQSYNVMNNSWRWHTMPGSPVIFNGYSVTLSDGRVLAVLDDYAENANSVYILDPRTWSWETLPASTFSFPPSTALYREGGAMVYVPDQNRLLLWGGTITALDYSYISDPAVHSLDLDDLFVGQPLGMGVISTAPSTASASAILTHDWLAVLPLNYATSFVFSSGLEAKPRYFSSVAGALFYYQVYLSASSLGITVLDRSNDLSLRARRTAAYGLAFVPITANVTIRGNTETAISSNAVSVLECASSAHLGMSSCFLNFTGSRAVSHVQLMENVLLRNFHNDAEGGALLLVSASMSLLNVSVESSSSSKSGGALWISDASLSWSAGRVSNASAQLSGGAVFAVNSIVSIDQVVFSGNSVNTSASVQVLDYTRDVYGFGGAVAAIASSISISNSNFSRNVARAGGAIGISGMSALFPHTDLSLGLRTSAVSISDSTFSQNEASELGGGLFLNFIYSATNSNNDLLSPTVQRTRFDSNSAGARGGAIYIDDSLLVANQTEFLQNECGDAGGAIFWQPSTTDTDWKSNQPILMPGGLPELGGTPIDQQVASVAEVKSLCVSRMLGTAWITDASTPIPASPIPRLHDSACNIASYGPFIATSSANLALTSDGRKASSTLQTSGAIVSPAVQLQVLDAFGQMVSTENSLYVSAFPIAQFAGESSVRAKAGAVVFENLILKASPNSSTLVTFTPGTPLVRYVNEVAAGIDRTVMSLTTSRQLYVGLQSVSNSTSFAQVATCAALCSLDLPLTDSSGTFSTILRVTFNVSMFTSSSSNQLTVSYGAGTASGSRIYSGADIAAAAAAESQTRAAISFGSFPLTSSSFTLELTVPSIYVRLTLQTQDDRVGYVKGLYLFSKLCPDFYALDDPSGQCLETHSSSIGSRVAIIVLSSVAELTVLVMLVAVLIFRDEAPIRATNFAFNLVVLILLLLLPIAGIVFALPPSASSDAICHVRCWLGSLPVIGVLSVLFAKAARVAAALASQSLKPTAARVVETRMWCFVASVIIAQVALCLVFTLIPISRSELRAQSLGSDSSSSKQYLIRQCVLDTDTFPSWFGAQLSLLGVLALGASYVSFLTRDAQSVYNESFHNSNALFMLVLTAMIVIPLAFLVRDSPDPILLLQGGAAAFLTIVWCAALFLPKLMQVVRAKVKRDKRVQQRQIVTPQLPVIGLGDPSSGTDQVASPSPLEADLRSNATISRIVRFHQNREVNRASPRPPANVSQPQPLQFPATEDSVGEGDVVEVMMSLSPELHTFVSNPSEAEKKMQTEIGNSIFQSVEKAYNSTPVPAADVSGVPPSRSAQPGGSSASTGTSTNLSRPSATAIDADNEHESEIPQHSALDVAVSMVPSSLHPASHLAHSEMPVPIAIVKYRYPQVISSREPEQLTPVSKVSTPAVPPSPAPYPGTSTPPGLHTTDASDPETVPPGWLDSSGQFNSLIK